MQFIEAKVERISQENGLEGMLKHIERCARVSYKSEDKITSESYHGFIDMLKNRGHLSPCEHGSVYLKIPLDLKDSKEVKLLESNKYTIWNLYEGYCWVTTNYRVIIENNLEKLLDYWVDPGKDTIALTPRVTIKVICSRGVSHELVRHRTLSFTQESTRYCNYSQGKHDSCIKCIIPSWVKDLKEGDMFGVSDVEAAKMIQVLMNREHGPRTMMIVAANVCAENTYMQMLDSGCKPQEARDVLPNGLKTELAITGSIYDWENFLRLRSPIAGAGAVHPDMAVIGNAINLELGKWSVERRNEMLSTEPTESTNLSERKYFLEKD